MIGDDVRDDVNGGINYGLMVCNDYQGLLYKKNTVMESFMSSLIFFESNSFIQCL